MATRVFMASCLYIFSMPWAVIDKPRVYVAPLITGIRATKTEDMEKPSYEPYPPHGSADAFINVPYRYRVSAYSPIVKHRLAFSNEMVELHRDFDPFDAYIISHNIGVAVLDEYIKPLLCYPGVAPSIYTLEDFLDINPRCLDESALHKIAYIAITEIKRESELPQNDFVKNIVDLQNEIANLNGNHR